MKPKTMYRIALVLGSQAAGLPNTLFGIPVIASINSPAQIALIDPGALVYSRYACRVSRALRCSRIFTRDNRCLVRRAIISRGNSAIRIYTVLPSKLWPEGYDHVERARRRTPRETRGAGHDLQKT
jgi:hypothetical protein